MGAGLGQDRLLGGVGNRGVVTLPPEKNKKVISETNDQDSVLVWGQNFFPSAYPNECFYAQNCDLINCS